MAIHIYSEEDEGTWGNVFIRTAALVLLAVAILLCAHDAWPRLALWREMPHWLYNALGFPFTNWVNATLIPAMSAIFSAGMLYTGRRDGGFGVQYDASVFVVSCATIGYVLLEMT